MALTTKQLCLINNLMYVKHPSISGTGPQDSYEGMTLGDLVNNISPSQNADDFTSTQEWENIVQEIKNDPQLMNIQIKDTYFDGLEDKRCLLVDPSTNEAVIAFRGTGKGEWKDNFLAGTTTDGSTGDNTITTQQQKALDYVDGLDLSGYDTVTVTGHSKGGNKAKLVALMNGDVDRCVSFDGQGFSDEFLEAHKDDIARNQYKIENHNVDGDFVNILLNDIGKTTYYKGQNINGNFGKNHSCSSYFTDDGQMIEGPQSQAMKDMDYFLNSMLRSMDPDKRAKVLDFAGEVVQAARGYGSDEEKAAKVRQILLDQRYTEQFADILAYTLEYENKTGKITDTLSDVLGEMGLGDYTKYVDIAQKIIGNDFLYGLLKKAARHGDSIPDSVISFVRQKFDIPMTDAELRQLLRIITRTGEKTGTVTVNTNNGADKTVADAKDEKKSDDGKTPTPSGSISGHSGGSWADNFVDSAKDALTGGIILFVQIHELRASCEELQNAVALYNDAIENLRAAAQALAQNWIGDSRDAFVTNQEEAFGWYVSMANIVTETARKLLSVNTNYNDAEEKLSKLIRG